ncbi:MAG: hypothetical protein QOE18_1494 [Chloroflexota bacterium]|nr:hypothetical protein [Chloroflexota bacterium]
MAKTWVLDTETKGTGAHVVPYEKTLRRARVEQDLALVELDRTPPAPAPAAPPEPLRFKVVNVLSSQVLAEGAPARETVQVLEGMRSVLDARIYVWVATRDRWRLLTLAESKVLWGFRGSLD